jgi:hypothetical protein
MFRTSILITLLIPSLLLAEPTAKVVDGRVVVSGVKDFKGLRVVVAEGTEKDIADRPAISGSVVEADSHGIFIPQYPFRPGTKYRVIVGDWKHDFAIPKAKAGKPNAIKQIHPASSELPENTLRFYVEFEKSMPRGDVYQYIELIDEKGKKVEQPFLELDDELWNADQTRLTLVIDPGRIKKEVKPRLDLGPVFMAGSKYTLVVSGKWPTLEGEPLGKDTTKSIAAKPPVNEGIDPKAWKLSAPTDETAALNVIFGRPLDHHLLLRTLSVVDREGKVVEGVSEAVNDDRGWTFRPTVRWRAGEYNLRVDTVLEDVCGNRIGQPFEIDVLRPAPKEVKVKHLDLPFTVGR